MTTAEFILYVRDQEKSREFYEKLFQCEPCLHVPGMTEFRLFENVKLGLMPESGIAKIIDGKMPAPEKGNGIPRCELYLKVQNAQKYIERGVAAGGKEISEFQERDWGDKAGYIADLDGHVLAFAESI